MSGHGLVAGGLLCCGEIWFFCIDGACENMGELQTR